MHAAPHSLLKYLLPSPPLLQLLVGLDHADGTSCYVHTARTTTVSVGTNLWQWVCWGVCVGCMLYGVAPLGTKVKYQEYNLFASTRDPSDKNSSKSDGSDPTPLDFETDTSK